MFIKLLAFMMCLNISFSIDAKGRFIQYSEAFDVFQIVDGISQWKNGAPKEYRTYYEKTFGITSADRAMLDRYKAVREKYHSEYPKAVDSIFSEAKLSSDILSVTFASVDTLDQGLSVLKKKKRMKVEDIKELVTVYKYFKKNVSAIVKESSLLASEAKRFSKLIKKAKLESKIKKLDKFFNLPTRKVVGGRIKLVWWPDTERPSVSFQGGRVILRVNPIKHSGMVNEEFLTKVVVQSLITSQGKTVKENLSKVFMAGCPSISQKGMPKDQWFEVPLIEALTKYYIPFQVLKNKFNPFSVNIENPWVSTFSKYIYGLTQYSVKKKAQFDREFVSISAKYCENLLNL